MRQRNDTGHVQDVAAWPTDEHPDLRPFTLGPGEEIDHPTLIGGFTSLEPEPEADPESAGETQDAATQATADPATAPAKSARKTAKATTASTEGGEPQ